MKRSAPSAYSSNSPQVDTIPHLVISLPIPHFPIRPSPSISQPIYHPFPNRYLDQLLFAIRHYTKLAVFQIRLLVQKPLSYNAFCLQNPYKPKRLIFLMPYSFFGIFPLASIFALSYIILKNPQKVLSYIEKSNNQIVAQKRDCSHSPKPHFFIILYRKSFNF